MSEKALREPISIEIDRQRLYLKGKMRNYMSRDGEPSLGSSRAPTRSRHHSHTGCKNGAGAAGRNVRAKKS